MSVDKFCREWAKGITNPDTLDGRSRHWRSVNVFWHGRTIYSYGTHFVMGHIVAPGIVWLNGDRYSPTTARHQRTLRSVACGPGITAVIVPGSALDAAGADPATIQPVHVEPERFDTIAHDADIPPAGMRTDIPAHRWLSFGDSWRHGNVSITFDDAGRAVHASNHDEVIPEYVGWIETERHQQAVFMSGGRYRWHTLRHWLGDAVFTAERKVRATWVNDESPAERVYWLSSFDRQESRPLYFLSQLPGPADTVDAATESLAPDSVRTARDMGRDVVRQGDMFAIETGTTTRALRAAGATIQRRKVTIEYRLDAQRRMRVRDTLRSVVNTMPARVARVYWDSSLSRGAHDALNEWHTDRITEWADETLARYAQQFPDESKWADMRNVYQINSALSYNPRTWDKNRDVTGTALLGTAHTATEVATMPDGLQYARGVMYHEPAIIGEHWRARDHARRPLGNGRRWYLIARNTVPVEPGRTR